MANTYPYEGPGTRWAEEDPTAEDYLNVSRINCDHLHEALNQIMDSDAVDGLDDLNPDADSTRDIGESTTPKRWANVKTDSIGDSGAQLLIPSSSVRAANVPMVSAQQGSTGTNVTGDGTVYTAALDTEIFDQGGDFASNTFTAPVTGRYLIFFGTRFNGLTSSHTGGSIQIVTSNRNYTLWEQNPWAVSYGGDMTLTGSVLADLDAADTVTATIRIDAGAKVVDVQQTTTFFMAGMIA